MSYADERHSQTADAVEVLLADCLEREPFERVRALREACSTHPELADGLRARWSALVAMGVLAGDEQSADADFPEQLGDFHLLERLGGGGMGVVYLARQASLGREVALKLVRPEHLFFPRAKERFQREAESVAKLAHPGIVPIYTVGEEQGIPYFAMERVRGCTLGHVLERLQGRAPESLTGRDLHALVCAAANAEAVLAPDSIFAQGWVELCLTLARQVADALAHAHAQGVLHRDVKPSNIMLTPDGRALLVDFGLAAAMGVDGATRTGAQVGTLFYMSSEQVRAAEQVDARTDVYGLGVTLYEMLTLQLPYRGNDALETQRLILAGRPDSIRARNRRVSAEIEVVCNVAIDVDPARRYASATAFARDLFNLLEHRPIAARPPSTLLRARRWAQRRPALATALALGAVLVVAVPWLMWRRQVESVAAERQRVAELRDTLHSTAEELQFLLGLFTRAGGNSPTAPVSVLDVLGTGERSVAEHFKESPWLAMRTRMFLARTYLELDTPEPAVRLLTDVVAFYRDNHPPFQENYTMEARAMLGDALVRTNKFDEAVPLLEESVTHYTKEPPSAFNKLDYASIALATACLSTGEAERAEVLIRDTLARRTANGAGEHDEDVARLLANLATAVGQQGRHPQSEELWRAALDGLRPALGPRHSDLVNALASLGVAIKMQGRVDDAQPFYDEALSMAHALWSEPNATTAGLALNYAGLAEKRNDVAAAERGYREAAELFTRIVGAENRATVIALGNLAGLLARNGRCKEAEELYVDVLPLQERALPPGDPIPGFSHLNLARCARARGELSVAVEHLTSTIECWRGSKRAESFVAQAEQELGEVKAQLAAAK